MTPEETDPDLPIGVQESPEVVAWVSSGLLQGWGVEYGSACMGHFEGGCHGPHYRAVEQMTHKLQDNSTK